MAADICAYIEYRDDSGEWVPRGACIDQWIDGAGRRRVDLLADSLHIGRDPYLFAKLGGVAVDGAVGIVPIAPPRGLPNDVSRPVLLQFVPERHHIPSWLTFREIADADWARVASTCAVYGRAWHEEIAENLRRYLAGICVYIPQRYGMDDLSRLRMVFWFMD